MQELIKILTLLFCSSENIYSVREKEEGDVFFKVVHFYGSLHINQASFIQTLWSWWWSSHPKAFFFTFHYPRREFFGKGKQPNIPCIHFYLTFFTLLDQRHCSWFSRCAAQSTVFYSKIFSRVAPFPVSPSASLSKQLLPATYYHVLLELQCQSSKGFFCIRTRTYFRFIRPHIWFPTVHPPKLHKIFIKYCTVKSWMTMAGNEVSLTSVDWGCNLLNNLKL